MTNGTRVDRDLVDDALESWARERPDLKTEPVAVVMRINRLAAHFRAELDAVFAEYGLSNASFELLATLRRSGGECRLSQRQLSDTLGLTAGTVSVRVKNLRSRGLLVVDADPSDGRVTFVRLTEQGQRLFDEAAPAHLANEEDLLRALSSEQQAELGALLRTLLLSFESMPPGRTPARAVGLRTAMGRVGLGTGLVVDQVEAGSPAAEAGVQRGDVIMAVAGQPVRTSGSLDRAIAVARRSGRIPLIVLRRTRRHHVVIPLPERASEPE